MVYWHINWRWLVELAHEYLKATPIPTRYHQLGFLETAK